MKMSKIVLSVLAIIGWANATQGQIVTDTLHADPSMHGGYGYWTCWDSLFVTLNNGFTAGDGPNWFYWGQIISRGFIGFYLPSIPDSLHLQQVQLWTYQWYSEGNAHVGGYPAWDVPGGDTLFCIVDHVDFGPSLSYTSWSAGDPGDPGTLSSDIGVLSDNATYEWKTLDVTEAVQRDMDEGRLWSQFRIRFQCDTDWDMWNDFLAFEGGITTTNNPMLILYSNTVNAVTTDLRMVQPHGLRAHPNPFNSATSLALSMPTQATGELTLYSLAGQKLHSIYSGALSPGEHQFTWDGRAAPSGIYWAIWRGSPALQSLKIVHLK